MQRVVPTGLDPETIARLVERHGSLPAAWQKARRDPRFASEMRTAGFAQWSRSRAESAAATAEGWRLVAAWDLLYGDEATSPGRVPGATTGRSPHRPREPLPVEKVEQLGEELAKRKAAGDPRRGPLTQSAIANRVGLERHRVQQAIELLEAGWELPESHPDFSANDGVRWPTREEALQLLGSRAAAVLPGTKVADAGRSQIPPAKG